MTRSANIDAAQRLAAAEAQSAISAEDELRLLEKIEKLLNMKGRTPEETATYAQKAQDLALAYNLDMARVGETRDGGRRAEEKLRGGFYEFERDLWSRVSELHFCLYWSDWVEVERTKFDKRTENYGYWAQRYRKERQHFVVGRKVNIAVIQSTMTYLLGAIERLTVEWLGDKRSPGDLRSRRAVSFREGVANDIATRLWERRRDQLADERRAAEEARQRTEATGMADVSSCTALTISSVRQSEEDANYDMLYGEGWSARRAARMAEQAAAEREAQEAYTRWAAENPEEAAAEEEKRRKTERKRRPSYGRQEKARDWGAFRAGSELGASISLDQQVSRRDERALPSK